ncbi:S8 family peptidase [Peribacillus glennii]|uniref:Peptidase S8 n=1 Tax=Peribacillus glennii TaxID=2303991 RepID=A0A372LFD2_9BACI|nr:S8 family peptidase [Peribacillus glennii]RFU64957.1 peptidase S8 [Peribacillus glennii]
MGRMRQYVITGSILLMVAGGAALMIREDNLNKDENPGTNRFSESNPRLLNDGTNSELLKINSLEDGNNLKSHLRTHPEITLIKHNAADESHYHEHQVAVKFKRYPSNRELYEINRRIQGKIIKTYNSTIVFRSERFNTNDLLQHFNHQENVDFAEPNYIYLQNEENLPNDSLYRRRYQWNLPAIQAEEGWDISRGSKNVVIAVVDTGVDLDHPDLRRRIISGYNVVAENHNPDDDNGHGTHVAGIIASETNNMRGVAGLTWHNKIMPIKAMAAKGYGSAFDIAQGVIWATDHGADIINLSLGNYQPSAVMHEAIEYAYKKNVVITVAAGNDNTDQPSFPAAYPEVLSVAAVDNQGNKAPFSNYGEHIDVAAPGVEIPSTYFHKQYAALSGTSMASPHVAAQAGLIKAENPDLKNTDIMNIITNTTYDLGSAGSDPFFGSGLIDIRQSLRNVRQPEEEQRGSFADKLKRLLQ